MINITPRPLCTPWKGHGDNYRRGCVGPIARLGKYGEEKFSSKIKITGKIFKTIRKPTYSYGNFLH